MAFGNKKAYQTPVGQGWLTCITRSCTRARVRTTFVRPGRAVRHLRPAVYSDMFDYRRLSWVGARLLHPVGRGVSEDRHRKVSSGIIACGQANPRKTPVLVEQRFSAAAAAVESHSRIGTVRG